MGQRGQGRAQNTNRNKHPIDYTTPSISLPDLQTISRGSRTTPRPNIKLDKLEQATGEKRALTSLKAIIRGAAVDGATPQPPIVSSALQSNQEMRSGREEKHDLI